MMVLQYKLKDVMVTSVEVLGSNAGKGELLLERISLNYGRIEWSYVKINEASGVGEVVTAGWDVTANKAI
jgi:type VI protein secretion system component Hcp